MNLFFRKLPLPAKLVLIALVPLLLVVYLTATVYAEKTQKLDLMENFLERIDQSAALTHLIDNLQAERQFSYEFVLKKTRQSDMLEQRKRTDSIIRQLDATADSTLKDYSSYSFLGKLQATRTAIDSSRIDAGGVIHFFSSTIFRLNTLNGVSTGNNKFLNPVYQDMTAQKLISEMITYLGIINANINSVLYTRQYVVETLAGTYPSYEVYTSYEQEFLQKASPVSIARYQTIRNSPTLAANNEYLKKTFSSFKLDSSYSSKEWEQLSAVSINSLRNLQMSLLQHVQEKMSSNYGTEKAEKSRTLILLLVSLTLALAIITYIIFIISKMLNELKLAALRIARGETGFQFENISNDVIGSLARSISKIDDSNKTLAEAARAIGQGNFDVELKPRSPDDLLGNALLQMRDNLQRSTTEVSESREQFRKLADFVPQIIWTADPDGNTDYYNKQWYEFTGSHTFGGNQSFIDVLHPDDVPRATAAWTRAVESGSTYEIEYRFRDLGGEYRWYLGRAVPVKNSAGEIVKWFGSITDIHQQKTMRGQLEALVKERTEELERSNEDLQQFAHIASHDLKEPLRKIRIFSSRLKEELDASLSQESKTYIGKIEDASARMATMIDGVLNYSMANNAEQDWELVDLNQIVEDIRQDLELLIAQKQAVLNAQPLPQVRGVRVLIYQLFYNLISNALKFSKPGEENIISLTVNRIKGVEVNGSSNLAADKEYTCIQVSDTGIGFDPAHADKMFQIFTRLNPRDKYEGTGLGLALCKKIVLRHHGYISATGRENEGASFRVVLPV